MSSEPTAGVPVRLEARIDEKRFTAADGREVLAVRDLAFAVPGARFTCLIGPSGCGKTTTLRIVLGLDTDFRGSIAMPGPDARVAVVFQEPLLLPWRTVEENVRLALPDEQTGKPLDGLFEELGIADMRTRYPGELSLGIARRVALARALAIEPDVLLLDEPCVSLDEATAQRMRRLLIRVWQNRPTTVLMVTHNVREAVELADRLIFLTARPARLRGEMAVPTPRDQRSPAAVSALLSDIAARFPGTTEAADQSPS